MKIVCDSCATKYSISDDKVRGKVFKIRCKKCSHIIVVRGTNDASAPATGTPSALVQEGGWHLVVDGDQVGPLPEADIRARLSRGEINAETYIWKDGFADWLKLSAVPEFAVDLATAQAAAPAGAAASGDLFSEGQSGITVDSGAVHQQASNARSGASSSGGGLFAGIDAADAALAHGASGEEDAFSPPVSAIPRPGGADLFSAHSAPRAAADDGGWGAGGGMAGHDGGRVENLTAQRHENSVLFSLANLQSLAMPGAGGGGGAAKASGGGSAPAASSEGSGLIDIRAMAATTLGSSSESKGFGDDLPAFGAFSPAAPMLLEMPSSSGPSKWIYPAIGIVVVLVGSIIYMAYKLLNPAPPVVAEVPPAPVVAPAAAPAPKAGAPEKAAPAAATGGAEKPAIPDEKLPPREGPKGVAAAAGASADSKPEKAAGAGAGGKRSGGKIRDKKLAAALDGDKKPGGSSSGGSLPPPAAVESPDKKPAKGSLDDLLESALNGKQKGAAKPRVEEDRRPAAAAEPAGGGPLSKAAVVGGMNGVKPKISECFNQFKVPGMAMVNVVIGKNGKVSSAVVTGKFAGTPTGSCVERAVKTAAFPPSDGLTTPYPFTLK